MQLKIKGYSLLQQQVTNRKGNITFFFSTICVKVIDRLCAVHFYAQVKSFSKKRIVNS